MNCNRRLACRHHPLAATLATLAIAATGWGQNQQIMIVEDDGTGPRVLHMTPPDLESLREPDFDRTDLPLMRDVLLLRTDQMTTVEELLDGYLEKLNELLSKQLPTAKGGQVVRMFAPGADDAEAGPNIELILGDALGDLGETMELDVDTDGRREVTVRVGVTASDGDAGPPHAAHADAASDENIDADIAVTAEATDDDGAGARVDVAMSGLDDADIPDELRAKLEEAAQQLVEQLQAQLEAGNFEVDGAGMMAPDIDGRLADHEAMLDTASRLEVEKDALAATFVAAVQAELDDPQMERWPALDRALVRHKTLPRGRLGGERTDLIAVLDGLDLSPEERDALLETRMAYEITLHQALTERNAFIRDANRRVDEALADGAPDRALAVVDRATRLRVAVRDLNTHFANSMAEAMPPLREQEFRDAVRHTSFPRVYGTTRGQRAFDAVLALADLDPVGRADVATLQEAYENELSLMNERIQHLIEKHQPDEARRAIEHVRAVMDGGDPLLDGVMMDDEPIIAAFAQRRALDDRYVDLLRSMLPLEMSEAVPALQRREAPGR